VVYAFSGVGEEVFWAARTAPAVRFLTRASTHIVRQRQLLEEEEARAGVWVEKPSDWIVAREQREYALADAIHVLGRFPAQSFLERGVDAAKLHPLRLGVEVRAFRAPPAVVAERQRRLRAGGPVRVLNVGTFCLRKGALDYVALIREADPRRFCFRFVGPVASDAAHLRPDLEGRAEFPGKRPQAELPSEYAWGDLFVLPTVEDGYPVVLPQALAGGLPVLTTPNSGAADLIEEGRNGWVLPARRPDLLLERLRWCDRHRDALVEMVTAAYETGTEWDWAETARQTEASMLEALAQKRAVRTTHAS
jgi:glycosyltransferase involved in cell wall biosynthesis